MPYIHLYDGGLTDNLGVRPFLNRMTLAGGSWNLAKAMGAADAHRMLIFVVNAQSEMDVEFRQTEVDLSLGEAITAVSSIPLNEYTFDSLSLLRLGLDGVASNVKKVRCEEWAKTRESTAGCDDFKVYFVEVDFDKLADEKRSKTLKHLPTSFVLSGEQVDDLRAAAREIVTDSRDFQEFMRDMEDR
jgi:NTE family protein